MSYIQPFCILESVSATREAVAVISVGRHTAYLKLKAVMLMGEVYSHYISEVDKCA